MNRHSRTPRAAAAALLALLAAPAALAQAHAHAQAQTHGVAPSTRGHWVVPHAGTFARDGLAPDVRVTSVDADVLLVDGIARTTLTVHLENPGSRQAEATLLLPVPGGAAVSGFDFEGKAPESTAQLLSRDEATSTYASIVARLKDPALLEFAGADTVRSSVFPVPAGGTQAVRLVLESVMEAQGNRSDYVLPRSESLAARAPWNVSVTARSSRRIADVYSPTHDLRPTAGVGGHRYRIAPSAGGMIEAGPLRLSVIHAKGPVSTTIFTSADEDGPGGYFLMLAGIADGEVEGDAPPREVTLVIDRSGSMGGKKFDQAIAAARQVVEGLAFGEAVQIVDYSTDIGTFAPRAVVKTKESLPALRAYLDSLTSNGGTNLDGALQAALATPVTEGCVPVVLFLTDGLATEGETREHEIRRRALENNRFARRIFTFGVGNDVNAPLLDAVADRSRGYATYVRPSEDVEVAIGKVFDDLSGPAVTDLAFHVANDEGHRDVRLVRDLYPGGALPDLFLGDRLLLLGRYTEARPATLTLSGTRHGIPATWSLDVDFSTARPRNAFVRRLWAMRRVAALEDDLRQKGADPRALASLGDDPRFSETVAEMLDLATTHGVLTDSTAFLAREGTVLGDRDALLATACNDSLSNNAVRSGSHGVSQQANIYTNRAQGWCNTGNVLYDASGQQIAATNVQTIRGRTFFRQGTRWTDGCLALSNDDKTEPDRTVVVGSPEYAELLAELTELGRAAHLSMTGEILLEMKGSTVLIAQPTPPVETNEGEAYVTTQDRQW